MADLHPQLASLWEAEQAKAPSDITDLAALRAGYLDTALRLGGAVEEVGEVEDVVIPAAGDARIRARVYRPRHAADGMPGAIVWLHGGGWVLGDIEGFDRVCRTLCNAAGHTVVSVDYRLAPEHPFPVPVQDADAALRWARAGGADSLGIDPARVIVGGDSAGGQLAAVATLHSRGDGLPAPRAQLLVYPALDPARNSAAYREFANGPLLTDAQMAACWAAYLGEADPAHPDAAPLQADVAGAPPALIAVAHHDPLRDDGFAYAEHLRAAGVDVEVMVFEDMSHGFLRWGGIVERSGELLRALGDRARETLSA